MPSVAIHVPITMNEHFSVMLNLLVRSLAKNAELPPDWRIIVTVSRDSDLTLQSECYRWVEDYPIEFRMLDQGLWDRLKYDGHAPQQLNYELTADVVLFMDADTLVVNSLRSLIDVISNTNAVCGWPAWFSPPLDFDELFQRAGIKNPEYKLKYSGYGIDFMLPKWAPPYFNFGCVGMPGSLANEMGKTFLHDLEFVMDNFPNYFASQVALALNIVRNGYDYYELDERYNVGTGDIDPPKFQEPEALMLYKKSMAVMADPRVLHYCVNTESFQKTRDMATWDSVRLFLEKPGLKDVQLILQNTIKELLP